MNGKTAKLQCRMYEEKFPAVGAKVMIKVDRIEDVAAYVSLLEYNNIEGKILPSEFSVVGRIGYISEVGRTVPAVVIRVDEDSGYVDLSLRQISKKDLRDCQDKYIKSELVHSALSQVAKALSIDLEELYLNIGWPLYKRFGHAFEGFKMVLSDPDAVLGGLTLEVKEVCPDGQEVSMVVPAITKIKEALIENMQPLKITADIEMTCFTFDGVLYIKDAMRKAEAAGNKDCPVRMFHVHAPHYMLTTRTFDMEQGIAILTGAIAACTEAIEEHGGRVTVKVAPRAVNNQDYERLFFARH